jgi:hypothetical protein
MPIKLHGATTNYAFLVLTQIESPRSAEQMGMHLVGTPTIGIGFDLKEGSDSSKKKVLEILGLGVKGASRARASVYRAIKRIDGFNESES